MAPSLSLSTQTQASWLPHKLPILQAIQAWTGRLRPAPDTSPDCVRLGPWRPQSWQKDFLMRFLHASDARESFLMPNFCQQRPFPNNNTLAGLAAHPPILQMNKWRLWEVVASPWTQVRSRALQSGFPSAWCPFHISRPSVFSFFFLSNE